MSSDCIEGQTREQRVAFSEDRSRCANQRRRIRRRRRCCRLIRHDVWIRRGEKRSHLGREKDGEHVAERIPRSFPRCLHLTSMDWLEDVLHCPMLNSSSIPRDVSMSRHVLRHQSSHCSNSNLDSIDNWEFSTRRSRHWPC